MTNAVHFGHEHLFGRDNSWIRGARVGLIVNPTSVSSSLEHLALRIHSSPEVELGAIFGPEHGMWGAEQDMISVQGEADPLLGVPVYSLYGDTVDSLRPPEGSLDGLDVLIFDIQDVGARYYTYVYTMMLAMEEAAKHGVRFIVCDRPNPINGMNVEGNGILDGFDSFVGMHNLANRHGMTAGELALLFQEERGMNLDLQIAWMEGWKREMMYSETGIPWVMPSPNMPTEDTALIYPGMCLLEGTNLSEGRGTTRPFELFGAPYLDGYAYAQALNHEGIPGVLFRPVWFRPTFQKHGGVLCGGAQVHVTDPHVLSALHLGIATLVCAARLGAERFQWRSDAYEFVDTVPAIDLLFGSDEQRKLIENGASPLEVLESMNRELPAFLERRAPFLHYGKETV